MVDTGIARNLEQPQMLESARDYEVVIVSYHSASQITSLLEALPENTPVVIADNAGNADGVREITAGHPLRRYLDTGGGKGFARAANAAVRTSEYEYVVFCNPDSRPTTAIIDELVRTVATESGVASASAAMTGHDERIEFGIGGWEPTVLRTFVHTAGLHKLFPRWGLWAQPRAHEDPQLEWVNGACMAANRRTFLDLGGFDERYFVYNEDMAFGNEVRRTGMRQVLRTDLRVPHTVAGSGAPSERMLRQRGASMANYLHDHNTTAAAVAMRAILLAGTAGRVILCTLRRQSARRREFWVYFAGLWTRRGAW